jgi:DNA helicase II / ATP-dependent DNA helicase PcrA
LSAISYVGSHLLINFMIQTQNNNWLNRQQRRAVDHGVTTHGANVADPLLILAGAGTGKTNTIAHRVANLICHGADPSRIMMLTFTRQAAQEMRARVVGILASQNAAKAGGGSDRITWAGTFHAIGQRLLRLYGKRVRLNPNFTVADRDDAADLLDMVRADLGLAKSSKMFPMKDTCLAIYSRKVNAQLTLKTALKRHYPWAIDFEAELRALFVGYVAAKQKQGVLDFDDLLFFWDELLRNPGDDCADPSSLANIIGGRFDHILVDEFQDTNALQASILRHLKPDGRGLTFVGDDAQAIYGFRAAEVRNILDFPKQFTPPATVIKLEQNYRSTAPILEASTAVIRLAKEGFTKKLTTTRQGGSKPRLVTVADELEQAEFIATEVRNLIDQKQKVRHMAVLFRSTHHSAMLQIELGRRGVPFKVFGGSRFTEAAHIKDLLGVLKWAENPADRVTGLRVLKLLPGIGHTTAEKVLDVMATSVDPIRALSAFKPPHSSREAWPTFTRLIRRLRRESIKWPTEVHAALTWYRPILRDSLEDYGGRQSGLEKLVAMARRFKSRQKFLTDLSLDQPSKRSVGGGRHKMDANYLTLSTIHSCKGCEWRTVFVLNVVEGAVPSSKAGSEAEIEEERRLLYVAMTRAKRELTLMVPWRVNMLHQSRSAFGDGSVARSSFIPESILACFDQVDWLARQ